jgi:hypothetical protein
MFCGLFAAAGNAEDASPASLEDGAQPPAAGDADQAPAPSKPPGDYPEHRFRSPFPSPVAEKSEDFEDKYVFGDWLGLRPELARRGIKLTLPGITDPFFNVTGGQRRG